MIVRVPASTANLGPGFDTLGLALDLHAEIGNDDSPDGRVVEADDHHPATVAYRRCGGTGRLWVRSPIPMGRGLGFSGAMRVGGAALAVAERSGTLGDEQHDEILDVASDLEGHADNAAASLLGGAVATAAGRAVRIPLGLEPALVMWVPESATTSTDRSRAALPTSVAFQDAVFNVGRVALLVAALAAGDREVLAVATEDRLHQDVRFAVRPAARAALEAGRSAGAWCGWLSGSGPSVALLCSPADADTVMAALPPDGRSSVRRIDHEGATLVG